MLFLHDLAYRTLKYTWRIGLIGLEPKNKLKQMRKKSVFDLDHGIAVFHQISQLSRTISQQMF